MRVFGDTAISTGFIIEKYMYKDMKINGHVHFTNTYLKRKRGMAGSGVALYQYQAAMKAKARSQP